MDRETRLDIIRRAYAKHVMAAAGVADRRIEAAFAEAEARRLGHAELRLYTHATMIENIALYTRLGFVETGRGQENGYERVFMTKRPGAG